MRRVLLRARCGGSQGIRATHLFLLWLVVLLASWIFYIHYSSHSDLCRATTCALFTVYTGVWGKAPVVIRCGLSQALGDKGRELSLNHKTSPYRHPSKGTSIDEFRTMLIDFLKSRLGEVTNLQDLAQRHLSLADADRDGQVSLAEAKSLWALAHRDDFLLLVALRGTEHTPRLLGFCGDTFVTEYIRDGGLYGVPRLLDALAPAGLSRVFQGWFGPAWPHRARIAIGLLEFTEEVFHGSSGSFLLCEATPDIVARTDRHDAKVTGLHGIAPEASIRADLAARHCEAHTDCLFGSACHASCDRLAQRCLPDSLEPNLPRICRLLQDYLIDDCPMEVRDELKRQLGVCTALRGGRTRLELHHSLVLNGVKALLWKQISNAKDS
uniref:divergent protein kinase domain 1B-like isoform X2 n=1 Tax=Myxine glutinosa TaxID=7769 RepID=UPI00358FA584